MKFQCDRCKTRYSIADERVRGKILKIRCKNCEAVITVREGMDAPSARQKKVGAVATPRKPAVSAGKRPTLDSKPVLRGAFEKAMDSTSRPPSGFEQADDEQTVISDPPQQLEEEWYVSLDGEQFGPFNLGQAQEWVRARPKSDELYCWSEGFDDWLPVDKVSHFRRMRSEPAPRPRPASQAPPIPAAARQPAAPPAGGVVPTSEDTPKPLFAATLEQIERDENPPVESLARQATESGPNGQGAPQSEPGDEGELEFEVGEASRVVKLPMLAGAMQSGGEAAAGAGQLPGVAAGDSNRFGAGTGGFASVSQLGGTTGPTVVPLSEQALAAASPDVLKPAVRRRHSRNWYLLVGGSIAAGVALVILMVVLASGGDESGRRSVRSRASAEGLGESLDPRTIKIIETREVPTKNSGGKSRGGSRGGSRGSAGSDEGPSYFGKTDEFDLTPQDDSDRPLDGDDLMQVYRDNRLAVKLCYERALKKDPLLDVSKIYVSLTVAPSGVVTKVLLSSHADTPLGNCLTARMRKWRFRKSPEEFSGRFPLVFRN